jgi:hypothetical protein
MTEEVRAPVIDATTTTATTTAITTTNGTADDTTSRCKTVQIQRHHPVVIRIDGLLKTKDKDNNNDNNNNNNNNNTQNGKTKHLPELLLLLGYKEWLRAFWLPGMQKKHPNLTLQVLLLQQRQSNDNNTNHTDNDNDTTTRTNNIDDDPFSSRNSLILDMASTSSDMTPFATTSQVEWEKSLTKELKKLIVEDLGPLQAHELWNTIPEQDDKDGRGRKDLVRIEQELNVKVVFVTMSPDNDHHPTNNNNDNKLENDQDSFLSSQQQKHHPPYQNHVLLVGAKAKLAKKCFVLRNILAHYYWRLTGQEVKL